MPARLDALRCAHKRMRGAIGLAELLEILHPGAEQFSCFLQQCIEIGVSGPRFRQPKIQYLFDTPCRFAERHEADHAATALERMEGATQRRQVLLVVRLIARLRQGLGDGAEDLLRFRQEDFEKLRINCLIGLRRDNRWQGFGSRCNWNGRSNDPGQRIL